MSNENINYTITAEDKFGDVAAKIKGNFRHVGQSSLRRRLSALAPSRVLWHV